MNSCRRAQHGSRAKNGAVISMPWTCGCKNWQCTSVNLGIVPDTLASLSTQLRRGLETDVVVILGASGRGDHDFAARAMAAIGAEMLFRGVATSPGRSVTVARCGQTLIIGLPGSPWAAFVGFEVFVWPALRALLGQRPALPERQTATLATPLQARPGITSFVPARLQPRTTGWCRHADREYAGVSAR